jgi:HEAT repeat protein
MWEILTLIAVAGGVRVAWDAWGPPRLKRRRLATWKAAVAAHDLRLERISNIAAGKVKLEARSPLLKLRIEDLPGDGISPTRIVIAARRSPPGFEKIRIRPDRNDPGPFATGDEDLDSTFRIEGPGKLLSALLEKETRHLLINLSAESSFEIAEGELRMETWRLPEILGLLLDLGQRCAHPLNIYHRLAQNADQDPHAEVRLRNLLLLAREFPQRPKTIAALHAACTDPSPQIRLRAAQELGAEGQAILVAFAESAEDDAFSAQAVDFLGRELPLERTRAILAPALRRRHFQTAHACLEALGVRGGAEDIATLASVIAGEQVELAVLAAKALGQIGTAVAVLPLQEAAGHTHDRNLRRAARQAIAEIQSRLQGASPGQLSLAGAEMGQLSLAETEAGELSLTEEQGGELSLPAEGPGV